MLRSELIRLGQEATRKMEVGGRVGGWVGGRLARGGAAMQTTPFLFPCLPGCLS